MIYTNISNTESYKYRILIYTLFRWLQIQNIQNEQVLIQNEGILRDRRNVHVYRPKKLSDTKIVIIMNNTKPTYTKKNR